MTGFVAESVESPNRAATSARFTDLPSPVWVPVLLTFQIGCQIALLGLSSPTARPVLRVATFGVSLLMLCLLPPRTRPHPSSTWALAALGILLLGFIHPDRNSFLAGIAQIGIYLSILAPIWWVAGLRMDARSLRLVIITMWLFYTASAAVGVLQSLFPGRLQPALSPVVEAIGPALLEGHRITLSSGESIYRPMGLTDLPGGAATGGLYAVVLGIGILLCERNLLWRAAAFVGMLSGLYCILLSQVRSILIMSAICLIALCTLLAWRRAWMLFQTAIITVGLVGLTGVAAALAIGGESVVARLNTLVEEDPATVYYHGRGFYLHYMLAEQLWEFPVGAGLGRWGMINAHFGDDSPLKEPLWAEIMWQGWLYDGGMPLMIIYAAAVFVAMMFAWRASRNIATSLGLWGAVILAYNVGALAVTFNNPIFLTQAGMEFWLLNACLWGAWWQQRTAGGRLA
jgi:hypothetical protein